MTTLTTFSLESCASIRSGNVTDQVATVDVFVHPDRPQPAHLESVRFVDMADLACEEIPDGLLLTYENYRALRNNITEYRREIDELQSVVSYYREAFQPGDED